MLGSSALRLGAPAMRAINSETALSPLVALRSPMSMSRRIRPNEYTSAR